MRPTPLCQHGLGEYHLALELPAATISSDNRHITLFDSAVKQSERLNTADRKRNRRSLPYTAAVV